MELVSVSAVLEQNSIFIAPTTHFWQRYCSLFSAVTRSHASRDSCPRASSSPPGPPGFLLPNRTIPCYWGSETGRLETGMEKAAWVQILNSNRDGDDAKLLPHGTRTHLCNFVHSSERRRMLTARVVPSCTHCRVTDALLRSLCSKCELDSPATRANKSSTHQIWGVSPFVNEATNETAAGSTRGREHGGGGGVSATPLWYVMIAATGLHAV